MKFKLLSGAILIALSLILIVGSAYLKPSALGDEIYSQMWNTGNVYYNTPTAKNLGSQLDTSSNATVLTVQIANLGSGAVNADTFTPAHINGKGNLSFFVNALKCTGTCTVNCLVVQPVESLDGQDLWQPIPGVTAQTVSPTSLTVGSHLDFTQNSNGFPIRKAARHYGIQFTGTASTTYAVQGSYYYLKE